MIFFDVEGGGRGSLMYSPDKGIQEVSNEDSEGEEEVIHKVYKVHKDENVLAVP